MASKKYKLLLAIMLLASGAFAQQPEKSTQIYDFYDSTVVPDKKMPQQNEFWNNAYSFPARPRNMWEVGVSGGAFNVFGDVSTQFLTGGFGVHVRKAFGYVFSLRLQYLYGTAKGMNWQASENFGKNTAWSAYNAPTIGGGSTIPGQPYDVVYYNYKNVTQDLGLQGIVTFNNIRFHKAKTNLIFYGGAGIGATTYETKVNALDANGNPYSQLFASVFNSTTLDYENRNDIRDLLEDGMDDSYETDAQNLGPKRATMGGNTLRLSTTVLGGMAYRLSKRINIALEDRHTFMKDDLLDGQMFQENPLGDAVLTGSWDSYNYLSLGINFNIGGNSVEPLWWVNPLNYAYDELNNPKHMKLPKPVFDDADGDGVIDQLDREPNTPAGCPVDTHGVTLDTDGDGVSRL